MKLPFPPSSLSGHNKGHWRSKNKIVQHYREMAMDSLKEALPAIPDVGDIIVTVRFVPPDKRGDRVNFPNRMKPYFDGLADALEVNDSRFLPKFEFYAPEKPGWVEVLI